MCTVCGCTTVAIAGGAEPAPPAHSHDHFHPHDHDHVQPHTHSRDHDHAAGTIDFGKGLAGIEIPGMSQARTIRIERDILSKNIAFADGNRVRLRANGIFALNFVSSPGSGKTSLLVRTINDMKDRWSIAVIEGDQQTSRDAERIRATGAPAVQVNTGKGCHGAGRPLVHRERRQSGLPGGFRPRRRP
jgi:hydrogenase nickel incorporation protein HypB